MKAHKKIIIYTFWLSIIFTIGTIVFSIINYYIASSVYQWFANICLTFSAGLIVPCIIEIGNYLSLKNKLYEQLFSDAISFYNILVKDREDISMLMKMIDDDKPIEEIKNQSNKLSIVGENYLNRYENFVKVGEFSFVSESENCQKGKRKHKVFNITKTFSFILTLVSQNIAIVQNININKPNLNNAYIDCFNTFQQICNVINELEKNMLELEKTYKFSMRWNDALLAIYSQNEISQINRMLSIYGTNANMRYATNQALSTISGLSHAVVNNKETETNVKDLGNAIENNIRTKKNNKKKAEE